MSLLLLFAGAGGPTAYTLTADSGSYAITGTAASLEYGRLLAADSGSYAITGTATSLEYGRLLTAASGSYTVTGTAAGLLKGSLLATDAGAYTISGTAASLEYGRLLAAGTESYAITGTAASLEYGRLLAADAGAYTITGADVTLTYDATAAAAVVAGGSGKAYRKRIIAPDGTIHEARSPRAYKELLNRLLRRIEYEQTPDAAPEQPKRKIAKTERQAIVRKLIDMPAIDYSGLIAAVETLQAAQAASMYAALADEEMAIVFLLAG